MNGSDPEYPDALPDGPARGRAAGVNPGNRFEGVRLHVLGDHLDAQAAAHPDGVRQPTTFQSDAARRIINRVESPDLHFNWTVNPYRGCEHGCIYCYARPTHETLGHSCGLDFESRIVIKHNAPELLRKELASPGWCGEPIVFSGVTDPYQPIERRLEITRRCLEVCAQTRQPVSLITKNRLITRDIDLLEQLAAHNAVSVAVSITTLDQTLAAKMEPRCSAPADRLRTIRDLRDAGVPAGVMMAPVIPGLTDHEIPALLQAARDHGAQWAGYVLLRLPHQVKALFLEWITRCFPDRAHRIEALVRETRGGELYDSTWGRRGLGEGARARHIADVFSLFTRRCELDARSAPLSSSAFRKERLGGERDQARLFDD